MTSTAVHIEIANTLPTDSFLNALREFQTLRGPIRQIRWDRGTDFEGPKHELLATLKEIHHGILKKLEQSECYYIQFKFNTPNAPHVSRVGTSDNDSC